MTVQIVRQCTEMDPVHPNLIQNANGLKHIRNVYQKVFTLQMFTGHYGVSVGFPYNIYGKGL